MAVHSYLNKIVILVSRLFDDLNTADMMKELNYSYNQLNVFFKLTKKCEYNLLEALN